MNTPHARLCVGLTGGIGSGKSTVARLFAALGAVIVDTDEIAHQLTQTDGLAIPMLRAGFGDEYITTAGTLDRSRMRQLVFSESAAKQKLENILHPLILSQSIARLAAPPDAPYAILMAPLLLESPSFLQQAGRVLVVNCTEDNQILRVKQRSGLDETEIRAIIAQQTSPEERLARADDIIQNDGSQDELKNQVATLHRFYSNIHNKNNI
jgi:dephospho-CoA kinase